MHIYLHCPWISWLPQFHVFPGKEKKQSENHSSIPTGDPIIWDSRAKTQITISIHHFFVSKSSLMTLKTLPRMENREVARGKEQTLPLYTWNINLNCQYLQKYRGCKRNKTKTPRTIHITVWYIFFSNFYQLGIIILYALFYTVVYVTSYLVSKIYSYW